VPDPVPIENSVSPPTGGDQVDLQNAVTDPQQVPGPPDPFGADRFTVQTQLHPVEGAHPARAVHQPVRLPRQTPTA
jgi:hypothetical protein